MIKEGEILGGIYQIIREIGQGGTGIIYLAEHLRLYKKVVVKKVKDNFVGHINERAEVDILKGLHHTCLPQVYDFLVIGGSIFTVMEYIEGNDLKYYLEHQYQFSEKLLCHWMSQLSEVLEYLHTRKPPIFHSDIKPENLMITEDQRIFLIDFNISIDGENSKDIQGISPWYAAPEQYEKAQAVLYGKDSKIRIDGRMDIYSLGAVFYRLMTGCLPSPEKIVPDIMEMEIPYSEGFKAIISKAMKRNPAARFGSAKQMSQMLSDVARMDPVYKRYGRIQAGGIFLWIILVITGGLMVYYGNWQNNVEKFNQAYHELYISTEEEDNTQIVSKATEMLNDFRYKAYMDRHQDQRAEILHVLGESYFQQENFKEASKYYKEAWEINPSKEGYCRDYVIAMIRDGQNTKAQRIIESDNNLDNMEMYLIQAEIEWAGDNKEEALDALGKIIESECGQADKEIFFGACLLAADIYVSEGFYGEALKTLEFAKKVDSSKDILRRMGQTAAEAATVEKRETVKKTYLGKAYECYHLLNQSSAPSYEDQMNLALTKRALEDYEGSNSVLKGMLREYSEDYRIPMWMCYNYLDIAAGQGDSEETDGELSYRYQDSTYLYRKSGHKNPDMEELIEVMEEK